MAGTTETLRNGWTRKGLRYQHLLHSRDESGLDFIQSLNNCFNFFA
jgi:hypothetical protein